MSRKTIVHTAGEVAPEGLVLASVRKSYSWAFEFEFNMFLSRSTPS